MQVLVCVGQCGRGVCVCVVDGRARAKRIRPERARGERTSNAQKIVFEQRAKNCFWYRRVALRPNPNAGGFAALVTQVALRVGCMCV